MKKQWGISIFITLILYMIGIVSIIVLMKTLPNQLVVSSQYISETNMNNQLDDINQDKKTIIHESQKLVVMIESHDGFGSGFLYNDRGDIITNAHVVAGSSTVKVKMADAREYIGTVIGISNTIDVAVVRVPDLEGINGLPILRDHLADIGEDVIALGSPLGLQNTVTSGIISGINRDFELYPYQYENVYQISAPIAPGNSGGPLISLNTGKVLGINSVGHKEYDAIGFSIPIKNVISIVENWSNAPMTNLPDDTYDDYYYDDIDEELAQYLVYYFYENLNYGDYVTAYSLLGSNWQTSTSYESFRNGYIHTKHVTIDDLMSQKVNDKINVVAIISAEETVNGEYRISHYKVTYEVGYENDQLKLISGTGEKITN